jgi:hypothetical protein
VTQFDLLAVARERRLSRALPLSACRKNAEPRVHDIDSHESRCRISGPFNVRSGTHFHSVVILRQQDKYFLESNKKS